MEHVCKLCLKDAKVHVKVLGSSDITKAIYEIFKIKINENNSQSLEILCLECHNTVAEFYVFYNTIKTVQNSIQESWLQEEEFIVKQETNDLNEFYGDSTDDDDANHERKDDTLIKKTEISPKKQIVHVESIPGEVEIEDEEDTKEEFNITLKKPRKVQTFYCDICGATFKKYNFMKAHILQKHLGIYEDVCPHCGKTSFDKSSLKRHIDSVHLKIYKRRRDICPDCGVAVVALKLHRQLKHGIGAKVEKVMYACDKCELQYTKPMYLKRHYQRKHLKQFNDKCPFCGKCFYNKMSVERHMQSQHPDLVPEEVKKKKLLENITSPCDVCDKVFHRRANFLRHRRTVHKDIPFSMSPSKLKTE
ncbi:zinc finger Y-chromosomal protein 1-like [Culicoides brevitarsis]|uniref:zinc finger Y-chromosomal protein 1-like n=1 Tax=Culicoides brevitarsis TaxID=469753 RepID=UPI00307C73E7